MNRRGFLGLLAAVAATAAFDPERLLWVPGRKVISIPPARVLLWVQRYVNFEIPQEDYAAMPESVFMESYVRPAFACLGASFSPVARRPRFQQLDLPHGLQLAQYISSPLIPSARLLVGWDCIEDRFVGRVDCRALL